MDWKTLPHDHSGTWEKKYDSIMAPGEKVTWPQLIAEFVVYWRTRLLPQYPEVPKGKGWSKNISGQVRNLNHQASVICNYFPHPDSEPLVIYATKKFFRTVRPLTIGGYRKNRVNAKGKLIVTQAEKDIVLGIQAELDRALKTRNVYQDAKPTEVKAPQDITFETAKRVTKKNNLAYLLSLEKQVKSQQTINE
jgi:hypothetical protein